MEEPNEEGRLRAELDAATAALEKAREDAAFGAKLAKEQLQAAKEKAKSLFLSRVNILEAQISSLEETARARDTENATLKTLLREADDRAAAAEEKTNEAKASTATMEQQRDHALMQLSVQTAETDDLRRSLSAVREASNNQNGMESARSEEPLPSAGERPSHVPAASCGSARGPPGGGDRCETAQKDSGEEGATEGSRLHTAPVFVAHVSTAEYGAVRENLQRATETIEELQEKLSRYEQVQAMGDRATTSQVKQRKDAESETLRNSDARGASVEDRGNALQKQLADAQERNESFTKTNVSLSAELVETAHKVSTSMSSPAKEEPSNNDGGEDGKVLEAKVSELERLLTAKQAEIQKVREKARSYLRDLNAERRETENRLTDEIKTLQRAIENETVKVTTAQENTSAVTEELDACLGVIAEKQKAIQALNMDLINERMAGNEAKRQTQQVEGEFSRYKERARVALEERDARLCAADQSVQDATKDLREREQALVAEMAKLQSDLSQARQRATETATFQERAQSAEAALKLLKADASVVSSRSVSRLDALQAEVDNLKLDLEASQGALEDAKSRHDAAIVRAEVAEQGRVSAEQRSAEQKRQDAKELSDWKVKAQELELSLLRSQESAAAAQRTAAVAARAMAFTDQNNGPNSSNGSISASLSTENQLLGSAQSADKLSQSLESPSPSLYSPGGRNDENEIFPQGGIYDLRTSRDLSELESRDQRIAVLVSQIAELGTLLNDTQEEVKLREQQAALLKTEVRDLDAKLSAAEKLQNDTPFSYMRTIIVRYLETNDPMLLPVISDVLSFTEDETQRIRASRGSPSKGRRTTSSAGKSYFPSLGFM